MNTRKLIAVTGILTAMAVPTGRAAACGHGAMALPVAAPMVGVALPAVGLTVAALPVGSISVVVNGATFFRSGPTWYQQYQAPTGMMYRVVPAPRGM